MKHFLNVVLLLTCVLTARCQSQKSVEPVMTTTKTFDYQGFDKNGNQITSGQIKIFIDSTKIFGEKDIKQIGSTQQIESGKGKIAVELDPDSSSRLYLYSMGFILFIHLDKNALFMQKQAGNSNKYEFTGSRLFGSSAGAPKISTVGTFKLKLKS